MSKTLKERSEEMLARIASDYDDHFARLEDPEATEKLCRPSPDMPEGKWYHIAFETRDNGVSFYPKGSTGNTVTWTEDGIYFLAQGNQLYVTYPALIGECRLIYKGLRTNSIAVHTTTFWNVRYVSGKMRQGIALPTNTNGGAGSDNEVHLYLYIINPEVTS